MLFFILKPSFYLPQTLQLHPRLSPTLSSEVDSRIFPLLSLTFWICSFPSLPFLSIGPVSGYFQFPILLTHYYYGHSRWLLIFLAKGKKTHCKYSHKIILIFVKQKKCDCRLLSHICHREKEERMYMKVILEVE